MSKIKFKFRLLPIFLFVAVLSLSIKINNVYDIYSKQSAQRVSISPSIAQAEEKLNKDTAELTNVLHNGADATNVGTAPESNAFSNSEILILQELAERREALDARSKEIDKRAIQLKVAESEIDKKIQQLKEYEQRLSKLVDQYNQQEQENLNSLVKMYASMKPKDAARIFNTMDLAITVAILKGMKPTSSSSILSQMDSEKAQAVTAELISNNI
jgi:flagellar motility protein MotE (MotC chaperone)